MSRKHGTRDKKDLYDRILNLLRERPEGLNAYSIGQELDENDATIRTYLADLVRQERVVGTHVTKKIIRYSLPLGA
jgi:DNA-binding IclR family transcriptional regulator